MSESVDLFCHIPKTAGSTLHHVIRSQYGKRAVLNLYRTPMEESIARVEALPAHIRVIVGHVPYSFRQHVPRPHRCFTVFREPVECIISEYFHIRRTGTHRFHKQVMSGEMTLQDCAALLRNRQACWVAGVPRKTDMSGDEILSQAKENLTTNFAAFGLTERFDETVALFNAALGWNVKHYVCENVNRDRPKREQLTECDMDAVREAAQLDEELYSFAVELFDQRIQARAEEVRVTAERLRSRNRIAEVLAGAVRCLRFSAAIPFLLPWQTLFLELA
ncbi:hypothetical protein ACXR0O_10635 [Verrucomicrobiota bacterium sgz303538]